MNNSGQSNPRPWEDLPNSWGFESLAEQLANVRPLGGASGPKRRTSTVGRDRLGIGFKPGDLLIAAIADGTEVVEVKDIVLDDTAGKPHLVGYNLMLDQQSGQIYKFRLHYGSYGSAATLQLDPVDMGWLGIHLGLVELDSHRYFYSSSAHLPQGFVVVGLQALKARCQRIDGQGKAISLSQDKLTAYQGLPVDRQILRAYHEARILPVIPDQRLEIQL